MSLNRIGLKNEIIQIMRDMRQRTEDSEEEYAERLSSAIDDFVKSATVVYTSGLTAPNGPVTGTFKGKLE